MFKKPLISFVISAINFKQNLEQCIESIILRKNDDLEIILIVNNNFDRNILKDEIYEKFGSNFIIYQIKNNDKNVYNIGLDLAKGSYILFIEPNICLKSLPYKELYEYLKLNNVDILFCNSKDINYKNKKYERITLKNGLKYRKKIFKWEDIGIKEILSSDYFVDLNNKIIRTKYLKDNKIYMLNKNIFGHIPFLFQSIFLANNIAFYSKTLVTNMQKSECNVKNDKNYFQIIEAIEDTRSKLLNIIPSKQFNFFYKYAINQILKYYFLIPSELVLKYMSISKVLLPLLWYFRLNFALKFKIFRKNFSLMPIKILKEPKKRSIKLFNIYSIITAYKTRRLNNEYDSVIVLGQFDKNSNNKAQNINFFNEFSLEKIYKNLEKIESLAKKNLIYLPQKQDYNQAIKDVEEQLKYISGIISVSKYILIIDTSTCSTPNLVSYLLYRLNYLFKEKQIDLIANIEKKPPLLYRLFSFSKNIKFINKNTNLDKLLQQFKTLKFCNNIVLTVLGIPILIIKKY